MFIDLNSATLLQAGAMALTTGSLGATNLDPATTRSVILVLDDTGAVADVDVEILVQATSAGSPSPLQGAAVRYGKRTPAGLTTYDTLTTNASGKITIPAVPDSAVVEVEVPLEVRRTNFNYDIKFINTSGAGRNGAALVLRDKFDNRYTYNS